MNRTSSAVTSHTLAAVSCLALGELSIREAAGQMIGAPTQVVFIQYPDGTISRLESSSPTPFRPGEQIWIHETTGPRQATVLTRPAGSWNQPILSPAPPAIESLPLPKLSVAPSSSLGQLVLPPELSASLTSADAQIAPWLRQMITYSGPPEIRDQVLDSAISAYIASARSWFASIPATPPIELKVVVDSSVGHGKTDSSMQDGRCVKNTVEVTGAPGELVNVLWHEFAHVATHNTLGGSIPRWFDEGLASLMESQASVAQRKQSIIFSLFGTGTDIPLRDLFLRVEAPVKAEEVLFYAKSLCTLDFLVTHGRGETLDDRRLYVQTFMRSVIAAGHSLDSYAIALQKFYKIQDVDELDRHVKSWVGKTYLHE